MASDIAGIAVLGGAAVVLVALARLGRLGEAIRDIGTFFVEMWLFLRFGPAPQPKPRHVVARMEAELLDTMPEEWVAEARAKAQE
jgi:hypothetical protein